LGSSGLLKLLAPRAPAGILLPPLLEELELDDDELDDELLEEDELLDELELDELLLDDELELLEELELEEVEQSAAAALPLTSRESIFARPSLPAACRRMV
jgi:hypothetical protein